MRGNIVSIHRIEYLSYEFERSYPVPPSTVFSRWLQPEVRSIWEARGQGWTHEILQADSRPGGRDEIAYTRQGTSGFTTRVDYLDIVTDARIVYAFSLLMAGRPIAFSLSSIVLGVGGRGTLLRMHEATSLLDGADLAELEAQGIAGQLNPEPVGHGVLRELPTSAAG
jgi:uncharacterized protein YndB with AHSA1/START domain